MSSAWLCERKVFWEQHVGSLNDWTISLGNKKCVVVIYLNFAKAELPTKSFCINWISLDFIKKFMTSWNVSPLAGPFKSVPILNFRMYSRSLAGLLGVESFRRYFSTYSLRIYATVWKTRALWPDNLLMTWKSSWKWVIIKIPVFSSRNW